MKFCGKCGAQMDDAAMFCPSCGAPSEASTQPQAPMQPQAPGGDFVAQLKTQLNGGLQRLGNQKWYYVAILGTLFLQFLIASLFDCLEAGISAFGIEKFEGTSLWHEEFGGLGVIMALVLLGGLAAAAAPLVSKLPFKPWNLYAAAGASGAMLIVTLWMYLHFMDEGGSQIVDFGGSAGFTFFGYLLIAAALATIVLVYFVNKALSTKQQ